MKASLRFVCLFIAFFSCWIEKDGVHYNVAHAFSSSSAETSTTDNGTTCDAAAAAAAATSLLISQEDVTKISNGGVAVISNFVPPDLVARMRKDAKELKKQGEFRPDGLTNKALGDSNKQGFTQNADRQTFRGNDQSWYNPELGDYKTRIEFDSLLATVRTQLANDLNRPTLLGSAAAATVSNEQQQNAKQNDAEQISQRNEITYNWYEPGAKLGRHLDEHHEETKGPKGWRYPSRRSVTWLVYLNDEWATEEGGALRCHPRSSHDNNNAVDSVVGGPIGSHEGNLQVGWIDDHMPVYLDAFRDSGRTALYSCKSRKNNNANNKNDNNNNNYERVYWSKQDFDVPPQPVEFEVFLPKNIQPRFEQISTARKDPRFANKPNTNTDNTTAVATNSNNANNSKSNSKDKDKDKELKVIPTGGTLVLFDSVTLPHSVLEVTGKRQRIAATGWFHEDSQFAFEM